MITEIQKRHKETKRYSDLIFNLGLTQKQWRIQDLPDGMRRY